MLLGNFDVTEMFACGAERMSFRSLNGRCLMIGPGRLLSRPGPRFSSVTRLNKLP
jgi:hypothetical protein